ncbi:MAG: hypothetical protein AAF220_04430 [Pseudomonadota bacterium]
MGYRHGFGHLLRGLAGSKWLHGASIVVGALCTSLLIATPAKAVSEACALVDGKTGTSVFLGLLFSPGETFTFNPGEAITVRHTKTTGPMGGSSNTMEIRTVQNTTIITAQALARFEDALGSTGTITWNETRHPPLQPEKMSPTQRVAL